ncbi:HCLS1-associated protein X-1-like isoform X2 [Bacillus rossius redtenbacheri]|uniref:HCLS1-associated protein X-1-like isoform X2 n=1 Tax=Bacillus rossius redtenbacheri TaxID=93214 RepID=UPI002FDEDB3A
MSLYNFMKRFFGFPDHQDQQFNRGNLNDNEPVNKFRKPWEDDDEDDDDGLDYRAPAPFGFRVFSNPVEIHRFFEHQMNEMLKMFQGLDGSPIFSQEGSMFGHDDPMFGMPALPPPFAPEGSDVEGGKPGAGRSLRDLYLKPGYDARPGLRARRDRRDSDLDDRIKNGELGPIIESLPGSSDPQPGGHKSGRYRSIITFSTTRPDGGVEERRTIDNGNGKEETITRRIGDKTYSVTTTTDSNGIQTRTERLINVDKDNLNDFEKNWHGGSAPGSESTSSTWFPFDKLFK